MNVNKENAYGSATRPVNPQQHHSNYIHVTPQTPNVGHKVSQIKQPNTLLASTPIKRKHENTVPTGQNVRSRISYDGSRTMNHHDSAAIPAQQPQNYCHHHLQPLNFGQNNEVNEIKQTSTLSAALNTAYPTVETLLNSTAEIPAEYLKGMKAIPYSKATPSATPIAKESIGVLNNSTVELPQPVKSISFTNKVAPSSIPNIAHLFAKDNREILNNSAVELPQPVPSSIPNIARPIAKENIGILNNPTVELPQPVKSISFTNKVTSSSTPNIAHPIAKENIGVLNGSTVEFQQPVKSISFTNKVTPSSAPNLAHPITKENIGVLNGSTVELQQPVKSISFTNKVTSSSTPNIARPIAKENMGVFNSSTTEFRQPVKSISYSNNVTPSATPNTVHLDGNKTVKGNIEVHRNSPVKFIHTYPASPASKLRQPTKYNYVKSHYPHFSETSNVGQKVPSNVNQMIKDAHLPPIHNAIQTEELNDNLCDQNVHPNAGLGARTSLEVVQPEVFVHNAILNDDNNLCDQNVHLNAGLSARTSLEVVQPEVSINNAILNDDDNLCDQNVHLNAGLSARTSLEVVQPKVEHNPVFEETQHGLDATNLLDRLRSNHSVLLQEKEKLIRDRAKFDQELDELNKLLAICDIQLNFVTNILNKGARIKTV
ncbi:uncharacterized protein LOC106812601 [Rhizophagus clarus]|uniref:Uncharacterized protein LOC106812601 n=1 Tax=Rhizophagus clarus TaxID=94130 RepID=A0A8H3KZ54_9GLOM|nr:uncharacterized protein LOC106812601 [Rhizophagus clarus]